MTDNGHRSRFDAVCDASMPVVSATIVDFVQGTRGRIFDLPPRYLDAAVESVLTVHPRALFRRALLYNLVSGRFTRSRHPLLRDLATPADVMRFCREWERSAREATRRCRVKTRSVVVE